MVRLHSRSSTRPSPIGAAPEGGAGVAELGGAGGAIYICRRGAPRVHAFGEAPGRLRAMPAPGLFVPNRPLRCRPFPSARSRRGGGASGCGAGAAARRRNPRGPRQASPSGRGASGRPACAARSNSAAAPSVAATPSSSWATAGENVKVSRPRQARAIMWSTERMDATSTRVAGAAGPPSAACIRAHSSMPSMPRSLMRPR
mmetsp:Transcript_52443/g.149627  ORF Transcript_52443/g.149627 Transcript_52443/m.149627 type:complete len:201 (-) Transcript_52443:224-826(-)